MEPQQGGDEDGLARGAWDWSLLWKRVPLSQRERADRKHTTQPYRYTHTLQRQLINTDACSVCVSISHPSTPSVLSSNVSRSLLVRWHPHPMSLCCILRVYTTPTPPPPMYLVCMAPPHLIPTSERCVLCLWSTPSTERSTPSKARVEETKMALLEEPGIGACSGREFPWERKKEICETLWLSPIGTTEQSAD